jgi:hypothetical protein
MMIAFFTCLEFEILEYMDTWAGYLRGILGRIFGYSGYWGSFDLDDCFFLLATHISANNAHTVMHLLFYDSYILLHFLNACRFKRNGVMNNY